MNQINPQATGTQNWTKRAVTAVFNKFFSAFTYHETAVTPHETRMFLNDIGFGWEAAMMAQHDSLTHAIYNEEV